MDGVRFPTVLFDLDGTLIDSGAMILSSFRHATRTVLAREIPDEELVATFGGATIHEQMRSFDGERVDELVRAYRAHNEPLHAELGGFDGVEPLLGRLAGEGGRLGVVTSKRRRAVDLAFGVLPLAAHCGAVITAGGRGRPMPDP